jgi:predicted DCC family thiol-disulfide oxidoreductase YuxK
LDSDIHFNWQILSGKFRDNVANPILLYDGVCGLCNRMVQFILHHDHAASFRFASLQSEFAGRILMRHRIDRTDLDTFYIVFNYGTENEDPPESLLACSDAALFLLNNLGGVWRVMAWIAHLLPHGLRDWLYSLIARNRYRIFGRYDTCPVPSAETRSRFLDI